MAGIPDVIVQKINTEVQTFRNLGPRISNIQMSEDPARVQAANGLAQKQLDLIGDLDKAQNIISLSAYSIGNLTFLTGFSTDLERQIYNVGALESGSPLSDDIFRKKMVTAIIVVGVIWVSYKALKH